MKANDGRKNRKVSSPDEEIQNLVVFSVSDKVLLVCHW